MKRLVGIIIAVFLIVSGSFYSYAGSKNIKIVDAKYESLQVL